MGAFTDPDTAARRREWKNALYYTTQAKATSTISSRLLVEGGYSSNVEYFTGKYQPGVEKGRGSPEWFTQTGHEELDDLWHRARRTTGTGTALNTPANGTDPRKHVLSGDDVVRHRHALGEDRRAVGVRTVHHARRSERRPDSAVSQRAAG